MPKSKEFVTSSEGSESEEEVKPKKKKTEAQTEKVASSGAGAKASASSKSQKSSDGEEMFQLSRNRFVTVSEFRGKVMVSIREYYDADGDLRPGKKGISLTLDQWNRLKDQIEDIDKIVKEKE